MADGTAGVTRTETEHLDAKSPRHEWKRGWKVVAVSLVAYVFWLRGNVFCYWAFSQTAQLRIQLEPGSNFRLYVDQQCDVCAGVPNCGPACQSIRSQARNINLRRICGGHLWVSEPSYPALMALLRPCIFVGPRHRWHNRAHLREGHFELVRQ